MRFYSMLLLACIGLFFTACQKDRLSTTSADDIQSYIEAAERQIAEADALAEQDVYVSQRAPLYLPAGTTDTLAGAIREVGPNGTIIVESGLHIETGTVTITHPVRIIGEPGAVIQSTTAPTQGFPYVSDPSIYITNAKRVHIEGIKFVPDPETGQGGTGILISYSDHARIINNEFSSYLQAVVLHRSDFARLFYNRAEGLYTEGFASFTSYGFIAASGKYNYLRGNTAEDFWGNYFASGQNGIFYKNTATGGEVGFVFCTFPGLTLLPGGEEAVAAEVSATGWIAYRNVAQDTETGYQVIDGTNNSRLVNNEAFNCSLYDYELAGPTERFGGPPALPTSSNIKLIISNNKEASVKDCGENNTVIGGHLVDLTEDPCF